MIGKDSLNRRLIHFLLKKNNYLEGKREGLSGRGLFSKRNKKEKKI
jgi:hypothetical protein